MKKIIYLSVGFICLAIGAIGSVLPILPTAPFLLVASFCFAKGSDRFNNWFKGTKLYKMHLDGFVKTRSMPLKTKIIILAFATAMLTAAFFLISNIYGKVAILIVIAFKYYYFCFKIKTVKSDSTKAESKKHVVIHSNRFIK